MNLKIIPVILNFTLFFPTGFITDEPIFTYTYSTHLEELYVTFLQKKRFHTQAKTKPILIEYAIFSWNHLIFNLSYIDYHTNPITKLLAHNLRSVCYSWCSEFVLRELLCRLTLTGILFIVSNWIEFWLTYFRITDGANHKFHIPWVRFWFAYLMIILILDASLFIHNL